MRIAVGNIGTTFFECLDIAVITEAFFGKEIASGYAYALIEYAGEIGFAADAGSEAAIKRLIPHIQFPWRRRVPRAVKVYQVVSDGDDVFIGADAIHFGQYIVGQLVGRLGGFQAPAGVC